jgi:hypothetical protein
VAAAADPASQHEEITKRRISGFKPRFEKASPPAVAFPACGSYF